PAQLLHAQTDPREAEIDIAPRDAEIARDRIEIARVSLEEEAQVLAFDEREHLFPRAVLEDTTRELRRVRATSQGFLDVLPRDALVALDGKAKSAKRCLELADVSGPRML